MSRYAKIDCPVCKKPLENGEEIVVCPDCGAPYHRHCYLDTGHCLYPELHEKGESWQPPRTAEQTYDGNASLKCSRCGTVNPPYGIFCQVCGNKLSDAPVEGQTGGMPRQPGYPPNSPRNQAGAPPYGGAPFGGMPFPPEMPLNPFTTPFGGVAPDEEIDGVPAKDLAVFVGRNSHYFLPRFKDIASRRTKTINWSAFIFHGGYFLYRKMWMPAVITVLVYLLLSLPSALMTLEMLGTDILASAATESALTNLTTASYVCNFLMLALRFFCGFFANTLYQRHCRKKILTEKEVQRPEEEYLAVLSKKGGVAQKLIIGIIIAYVVLYLLSMYSLILMGGIGGF